MSSPAPSRSPRILLIAAVALVVGWFVWDNSIKPNLFPKNFGVVVAGQIYRSGELTPAAFRKVVQENAIKTVVDLGTWPEGSDGDRREQRSAEALGVTRYRFSLSGDGTGNPNYYVQTLRLMNDPARRPILVHCGAGSERTGCAVILYRHLVEGKPIAEAFPEATEHRHNPGRNPKMLIMLAEWGDAIARAFRDGGQIPGVAPAPEAAPVDLRAASSTPGAGPS